MSEPFGFSRPLSIFIEPPFGGVFDAAQALNQAGCGVVFLANGSKSPLKGSAAPFYADPGYAEYCLVEMHQNYAECQAVIEPVADALITAGGPRGWQSGRFSASAVTLAPMKAAFELRSYLDTLARIASGEHGLPTKQWTVAEIATQWAKMFRGWEEGSWPLPEWPNAEQLFDQMLAECVAAGKEVARTRYLSDPAAMALAEMTQLASKGMAVGREMERHMDRPEGQYLRECVLNTLKLSGLTDTPANRLAFVRKQRNKVAKALRPSVSAVTRLSQPRDSLALPPGAAG